jgi:hypothetical protein
LLSFIIRAIIVLLLSIGGRAKLSKANAVCVAV